MPQWFIESWIVMVPLSVCSVVGLAIVLERVWALRRRRIVSPALAAAIQQRPQHHGENRTGAFADRDRQVCPG